MASTSVLGCSNGVVGSLFSRKQVHNPRTLRTVRRPVRAVAETDKETQAQPEPEVRTVQNEPRNLTFGNNSNAGVGYTVEDSAGQSNIFAVEPKMYVQGSSTDTTTGSSDNLLIAVTAAVVGIGAIAVGISVISTQKPTGTLEVESAISLSQYKKSFEASLAKAPTLS